MHSSRSARIKHMRALTRRRYKLRPWSRRKRRFLSPSPFSANPRPPRAEKVRHPRILHPDLRHLENLQWKMVLDQPRHWRPDGARLSHQGLGDGFCGSGESPVRLPPSVMPGTTASAEAPEVLPAPRGSRFPVQHLLSVYPFTSATKLHFSSLLFTFYTGVDDLLFIFFDGFGQQPAALIVKSKLVPDRSQQNKNTLPFVTCANRKEAYFSCLMEDTPISG